ncbi:hypothetical protein SDB69_06340 [Legionella pneumophila serogroup 1]|nr:hypothetical protein [Legionella pneumophila]
MNVVDELRSQLKEARSSGENIRGNYVHDFLCKHPSASLEDLQNLKSLYNSINEETCPFLDIQLVKIMSMLLGDLDNKDILIPWADFGTLPKYLIENNNIKTLDIISIATTPVNFLQQLIGNHGRVVPGDAFYILEKSKKQYDCILGVLPFGRMVDYEYHSLKKNYEDILIAVCIDQLKDDGKVAFVVCSSFFRDVNSTLFNQLKKFDIHLEAVVDLPSGIFRPWTSISAHIIVMSKKYKDTLFLAQYTDEASEQIKIAKNFLEGEKFRNIQCGVWHSHTDFKTFSQLENEHRISFYASRAGLEKILFKDIIKDIRNINLVDIEKYHNENCIYFYMSNRDIFKDIDTLNALKNQKVIRIEIDENKTSPDFLVEYFNKNQLGKMIKDSFYRGIAVQTIKIQFLQNSNLYLPNKPIQSQIGNTCNNIKSLKLQLKELEEKIWQNPNQISKYSKELELLNEDTKKNIWVDELPFPLASILWLYYSDTTSNDKTCYERMLHFFEAFCEFMTVIHLSIYENNPELWSVISESLKQELRDKNFNLEIATFGTWLTILERLVKQSRKLLNDKETVALIKSSYCIEDTNLLNELFGKKIISILKETINLRNSYSGHVGIVNEKQAAEIHDKLKTKLIELREAMAGIWDNYKLIIPENSRYDSNYFLYQARNITGSKTPFGRIEIMSVKPMQDGKLHIYSKETNTPIELLPFIKVVPSPKTELDACYFYNRMEKRGNTKVPRFISYHFELDSEQYLESEKILQFLSKMRD